MLKKTFEYTLLDVISCLLGWAIACLLWLLISQPALAGALSKNGLEQVVNTTQMAIFSPVLIVSAVIGAVGSYLAFGEDKKFPPSSASIGHVLLNFGAGLFLTRGSLELMGHQHSSHDVIVFTSFLWASVGYFLLRMLITVAQSEQVRHVLPLWLSRVLGVKDDN